VGWWGKGDVGGGVGWWGERGGGWWWGGVERQGGGDGVCMFLFLVGVLWELVCWTLAATGERTGNLGKGVERKVKKQR